MINELAVFKELIAGSLKGKNAYLSNISNTLDKPTGRKKLVILTTKGSNLHLSPHVSHDHTFWKHHRPSPAGLRLCNLDCISQLAHAP